MVSSWLQIKCNDKHVHDDDFFLSLSCVFFYFILFLFGVDLKRNVPTRYTYTHAHTISNADTISTNISAKYEAKLIIIHCNVYIYAANRDNIYPKSTETSETKFISVFFLAQSYSEMMWNIATFLLLTADCGEFHLIGLDIDFFVSITSVLLYNF